jgi:poly(A) polymerase
MAPQRSFGRYTFGKSPGISIDTGMAQVQTSSLSNLPEPTVIARSEHCVSRKAISSSALKVLYRLNEAGFASYLVGGGVRDLLLERHPKDFDIATDASPEEVKELFRNCRLIGRRFRLAHVVFGREIIEVATFRADHSDGDGGATGESGRIVRDNVYGGSLAEDAVRRDFTVNAMYYNIADFSVVDFYDGRSDIENRQLRFIGNASERVIEDPVRALRAVRFAAKLDFDVDDSVRQAIESHRHLLKEIPAARLFEEVLKLLQSGDGEQSFAMLREFDLLQYLFPLAARRLDAGDAYAETLAELALRNTDRRIRDEQPVTPAFIYAVLLWPDVVERAAHHESAGEPSIAALHLAADEIIPTQLSATSLPRRYSVPMREIWALQPRLMKARGKRATSLLGNPRFRAAYDFLCLRNDAGEDLAPVCKRWEDLQQSPESQALIEAARKQPRAGNPRRRRRRSQSGGQS